MNERWREVQEIFASAVELTAEERERFLAERCAGDADLLDEVRTLLAADAREGILDRTAPGLGRLRDMLAEPAPERAGPYVVGDEIGHGGMGVVHRAHDPRLKRDVALKFLTGALHGDLALRGRFIAEAQAASALDHPHVCTIHDIGLAEDGRLYIAMAYYARGTLERRLEGGPLPVAEAVAVARQVAGALDAAHAAGIVHRDIKPANIAFDERGEAKVLDFGVALLADEARGSRQASAGTPAYMAPEQIRGGTVDARADIWALGVVLYEMLSGRHPFAGPDRAVVQDAILRADPPDLAALRPELPPALVRAVARALAKDPDERFAAAGELAAALAVYDRPVHAATRRRARLAAAIAGGALALAAVVLAFDAWPFGADDPAGGAGAGPAADLTTPGGDPAGSSPATALGAGVGAAADLPADPEARDLFLRGRERLRSGGEGAYEAAIVLFESVLERVPDHAPTHALLARAYAFSTLPNEPRGGRAEWVDTAEVHARRAIELAPRRPDGFAALGAVLEVRGDRDAAIDQHLRALEFDSRYALSMFDIGRMRVAQHRYDEGVIWLEHGLVFEPAVPAFRRSVAVRYRGMGLYDHAWRHIEAGLRVAPDDVELRWEAVLVALETGDVASARRQFDMVIGLIHPSDHNRIHAWFGFLTGDLESARSHAERAGSVVGGWYDYQMYGLLHRRLGDTVRSDSLLLRAISLIETEAGGPGWGEAAPQLLLAHLYAALRRREDALAALEAWNRSGGVFPWRKPSAELRAGLNIHWVDESAPEWDSIRDDPRFRRVVEESTARLEAMTARVRADLDQILRSRG